MNRMWIAAVTGLLCMLAYGQEPPAPDCFPLKVGHTWVYEVIGRDEKEAVMTVFKSEKIGDVECFVLKNWAGTSKDISVAASAEGIRLHKAHEVCDPPRTLLKYPLKKGDVWDSGDKMFGVALKIRNEGEEEIKVPAGTFMCWKIATVAEEGEKSMTLATQWFAPGMGLVKMLSGKQLHIELKSFAKGEESKK